MSQSAGKGTRLLHSVDANLQVIKRSLGNSSDLIVKEMTSMPLGRGVLLYMDGLADSVIIHHAIQDFMLFELPVGTPLSALSATDAGARIRFLLKRVITAGDLSIVTGFDNVYASLLSGEAVLMVEQCNEALSLAAEGWKDRNVSEPTNQSVIRGPMEAFTENIRTNTALIRRKIKNNQLWLHEMQIGKVTKTNVAVMFVEGIAEQSLVDTVMSRLKAIQIDGILESGYIESFIQDKKLTPFPTVFNTERPDSVAAGLLEGRVAIIVDGTPFVLLVPSLFVQFFQSAEDYYQRSDISSLLRLLRYISFLITMLAPSVYIAITTFHQEMLPTNLLINLAAQREGVPFPAFIEALLMEITFEILREAGVRMPKTVGQAVSIVGTLVIGQAAVDAGIVSAAMVIIVSITAISSFVIPAVNFSIAVRMIRFPLMALSASFGLLGILFGLILLALHLSTLSSFGVPYLQSIAPFRSQDQKDVFVRRSWPFMKLRPSGLADADPHRLKATESSPRKGKNP